jgi:hypothetical protein
VSDYNAAVKRFRAYHTRAPRDDEIVDLKFAPCTALVIGECYGIKYLTEDSKKPWQHLFHAKRRPLLLASSDGNQIYIVKGRYKFTDRGIVG